jgi:TonB family protein
MSYKSLLFCPDERTARVVTQILTELEFAVEAANEPFGAVKKLNDERFDALVVDCQNEQDASLLFKTARDSNQNHSSLSVAVVEGQAGVAKAFRIGANLVLTKPINVEQSKGTLRVARGLLRKNEPKPATAAARPTTKPLAPSSVLPVIAKPSSPAPEPPPLAQVAPIEKPEAPFSALELEAEPMPAPEAAEVAVLESLPDITGKSAKESFVPTLKTEPEPIAASTSGLAAAVAPALEKPLTLGLNAGSMPPMVTNEPIVPEHHFEQSLDPSSIEAPTFSYMQTTAQESSGGAKFFKFFAILLVAAVCGYLGWHKLQPLQYLQRIRASHSSTASQPTESVAPAPENTSQTPASSPSLPPATSPTAPAEPPSLASPEDEISATPEHFKNDKIETIRVQELPMNGEQKPTTAPKPEPLLVKPDTGIKLPAKSQPAAAPAVPFSALNSSGEALPAIAVSNPALPQLAPSSMHVSQGVSQGLLLKKVAPVYPPMALQLHREGSVEILATISKQGTITGIRVLNGDAMLTKAAADAVRQWKYRPYLLNGEPVEIQTQITITFKTP